MFILLAVMTIVVIYIYSFKENFTQDKIDKVAPIFILGAVLVVLLTVVSALLGAK